MKTIEIEEAHDLLLCIAKQFATICNNNRIPYYMLGGTMLGAVRHKGFIPWDDDMDFGVPRSYFNQLIQLLDKDLPAPYRCLTYKNHPGVYSAIIKLDDSRTVVIDPNVREPIDRQIGLSIDIFPLDYCNINDVKIKRIFRLWLIYQYIYVGNSGGSRWKNMIKDVLSTICPISRETMLNKMHSLIKYLEEGPYLANIFGAWKYKEFIPKEWYGDKNEYAFEDTFFYGLKEYDKYLCQMYGDYMTPPVGDRHIHLENVYWR